MRLALGAEPKILERHMTIEAMIHVSVALVIGLGTAMAIATVASQYLFGVTPVDIGTMLTVVGVVTPLSWTVVRVPLRRIATVDVSELLRKP
jgi:hypothetical protein